MPSHPKISAALNNCPLHILTPELRSDIKRLAQNENEFPAQFRPAYDILREKFLAFYLPDIYLPDRKDIISWAKFHDCLESYNEFDIQILFGPVLRQIMADNMRNSTQLRNTCEPGKEKDEISFKTSLQENGRYQSLSPDEVFIFVAANFGLNLTYRQGDQMRSFPDAPIPGFDFEERPTVPMVHQGGVDGAGAGGHWERTGDEASIEDYEQGLNAHLSLVAGLFRQDSLEVTQAGFELLRWHVGLVFAAPQHSLDDYSAFIGNFNLTTAQIEKFLYNRLWVPRPYSSLFLGLTDKAREIIKKLPNPKNIDYDQGLCDLLALHQPGSKTYNVSTKQAFTPEQYQVALTLLTPAVPQILRHTHEGRNVWPLRANEISALQSIMNEYAQLIAYDQGLSDQLYKLCNQPEIANNLSWAFIEFLNSDPDFDKNATKELKGRVNNHSSERVAVSTTPCDVAVENAASSCSFSCSPLNFGKLYADADAAYSYLNGSFVPRNLFPECKSIDHDRQNNIFILANKTHLQPVASPWNTYFWLRAMQVFLALGGVCAVIAVLTCPPVAAALGITTVFGVAASEIAVTATFLAGTSALLAASVFAVRLSEGEASPVTPLSKFG